MTVLTMLRHMCSTQRVQAVGTNGRQGFTSLLTNVPCKFRPLGAQASIQNNIEVGYGFSVVFEDGTDVQVGDRLIWNAANYLVKGRAALTGYGVVSYLRVVAESEHSNGL